MTLLLGLFMISRIVALGDDECFVFTGSFQGTNFVSCRLTNQRVFRVVPFSPPPPPPQCRVFPSIQS
jgi:hypothetical protein